VSAKGKAAPGSRPWSAATVSTAAAPLASDASSAGRPLSAATSRPSRPSSAAVRSAPAAFPPAEAAAETGRDPDPAVQLGAHGGAALRAVFLEAGGARSEALLASCCTIRSAQLRADMVTPLHLSILYACLASAYDFVAVASPQAVNRKCVILGEEADEVCSNLQLAEGLDPSLVRAIARLSRPV